MVIMLRTGWMNLPAENSASAVSMASIRGFQCNRRRTSASSKNFIGSSLLGPSRPCDPFATHRMRVAASRHPLAANLHYSRPCSPDPAQQMAVGDQFIEIECVKQPALIARLPPHHRQTPSPKPLSNGSTDP